VFDLCPFLFPTAWLVLSTFMHQIFVGEDIWRYVGKLTDAQKSMLDDRFKWKVGTYLCSVLFLFLSIYQDAFYQVREMEKKKEGRPGEARAALRRSVRENRSVLLLMLVICMCLYHLQHNFFLCFFLLPIFRVLCHDSQFVNVNYDLFGFQHLLLVISY
jgi:hypothetical protein